MKPKRARNDEGSTDYFPGPTTSTGKRYCQEGVVEEEEVLKPIEMLEYELQQSQLNIQEIGRIIADGMMEKTLNDECLNELIRKLSKCVPTMANIDLFMLSDDLSRGSIDSRLTIIGNAFLWNLLKGSMSSIRDKFDHYHFKMSTMSNAAVATCSNSLAPAPVEFSTTRVRLGDHMIQEDDVFIGLDLLNVYSSIVFRKNGDLQSKSKQFIKTYLSCATRPPCAIWHYSLRQSGASHKKWLLNIPEHVLDSLIHFMLSLAGLGAVELMPNGEEVEDRGRFYMSLGDNDEQREATLATMKMTRESLVQKFRQNVTDALNEAREMPFNTVTRQLLAPPRGKPLDNPNSRITWRQYEMQIKRCEHEASDENLQAKEDMEQRLLLLHFYPTHPARPQPQSQPQQQQSQQQRQVQNHHEDEEIDVGEEEEEEDEEPIKQEICH